MKHSDDKSRRVIAPGGSLDRLAVPIGVRTPNSAAAVWSRRQRRCPRPMPIVFAFFIAFATCATGVLAFEWALSSRKSSLVHGLRTAASLFSICCSSLPAVRRDSTTYIRFARVLLRAEEKSARARTRKVMESALSALEPRGTVTRNSAFHASARPRPCSWACAPASKTMRHEVVSPDRNLAKELRSKKPAQRLHSGLEP